MPPTLPCPAVSGLVGDIIDKFQSRSVVRAALDVKRAKQARGKRIACGLAAPTHPHVAITYDVVIVADGNLLRGRGLGADAHTQCRAPDAFLGIVEVRPTDSTPLVLLGRTKLLHHAEHGRQGRHAQTSGHQLPSATLRDREVRFTGRLRHPELTCELAPMVVLGRALERGGALLQGLEFARRMHQHLTELHFVACGQGRCRGGNTAVELAHGCAIRRARPTKVPQLRVQQPLCEQRVGTAKAFRQLLLFERLREVIVLLS
mmetsp:Transcript_1355/g.3838  ORF Transcript_1355/g.3838 Transcript_1355/m.3838 type:complete len:261 (-) Transcript_1355:295-1077(-)